MRKLDAPRTPEALRAMLLCVGAIVLAAGSAAAGCADEPQLLAGTTSSSSTGGSPDPVDNRGEELFNALQQEFSAACASCHAAGGIADTPFLAEPNVYMSALSWPGIVTKDPTKSILRTHAITGGGHSGPNLDSAPLQDSLLPKIVEWLEEEAKGIFEAPVEVGPSIEPFTPILGFNAVYLDGLGPAFRGMAVTFIADELTPSTLQLIDLQVHPTSEMGVHMVHPLFVVYPKGVEPDPDPTDSFSNVDQYFDVGLSEDLGPGLVILTNWRASAKLSIAFEVIEPFSSLNGEGGNGNGTGGCKDVTAFSANAQARLQQSCVSCHGGNNASAKGALDMSQLQTDVTAACGQVKNRVKPADPPTSQIFLVTDPGQNASHPFKFGGDANAFNTFRTGVSVWINAEK